MKLKENKNSNLLSSNVSKSVFWKVKTNCCYR